MVILTIINIMEHINIYVTLNTLMYVCLTAFLLEGNIMQIVFIIHVLLLISEYLWHKWTEQHC